MKKWNMFLYGTPYSGKTQLASTFPKPFIVSTDGNAPKGINSILITPQNKKLSNGAIKKQSEWEYFNEVIEQLLVSDKVETIIIDLMLDVFEMCRTYQLKKLGISHESEAQFGIAYDKVRRPFTDLMRKISNSDKHIVFITHENEEMIGGKVSPNISNKIVERLTGYTQLFGRLVIKEDRKGNGVRSLVAYSAPKQIGGNRFKITEPIVEPTFEKIVETINKIEKGE